MHRFWKLALAAPAAILADTAQASINFGNPYVFVTDVEAEKGVSLPLYGGSEREVSYVSVRVYRWVQKDGDAYALEPAPEVAVYPQMVRLEPQSRSTVRLAWTRAGTPVDERYYRLVLEEFDRPGTDSNGKDTASFGFRVRPRASLPLVVYRRNDLPPAQLSAKIELASPAPKSAPVAEAAVNAPDAAEKASVAPPQPQLRIVNSGGTYGRVMGIRDAKGTVHSSMVYVLPGSTVDLPIPGLENEQGLQLLFSSGRAEHVRKEGMELHAVPIN